MYKPPSRLFSQFCVGPIFGEIIYKLMISNKFKNVLEIGCLNGYSTYSFVSALRDGANFEFTICDTNIQPSVKKIIEGYKVQIKQDYSKNIISKDYDFIFVDGDHTLSTVSEELYQILDCDTKTILAHDTFINHPNFKGAVLLRKVLESNKKYYNISYNKKNEKDQTHYGLSLFTQDEEIYNLSKELFDLDKILHPKIFV